MYIQKENIPYGVWSILSATQRIDGISAYAEFNLCIFIHLFGFFSVCLILLIAAHGQHSREPEIYKQNLSDHIPPFFLFYFEQMNICLICECLSIIKFKWTIRE